MLRSKLYIGMFPVVGLLIAVCLYSVYKYKILSNQLNELQTVHYASISKVDQLLLATSQLERAIRLNQGEDKALAERIYDRSRAVLESWLEYIPVTDEVNTKTPEAEISLLVRNLLSFARNAFSPSVKVSEDTLRVLLERIEATAIRSITLRNEKIIAINSSFQSQSRAHFQVVLVGIVASVIMTGVVAYFLSQRILAPIDALAETASKLADNDWETDYQPSSKDEIAGLEHAFVGMTERIREYKLETSKKIMRTRLRMEKCFSKLPHPVMFINSDRTIVYKNPIAMTLIEELEWDKELPQDLTARIESVFGTGKEVLATDFEQSVNFKVQNHLQHYLPIVVRIDSENTHDIECALILQDVTKLRLSDELKSDLVATLSHEIKTPVTSANLALLLVLEKSLGELNEDQEEMIKTAADDLKRLQRLLDHMLQIARLEQSIPKLDTIPCTAEFLIQTAIENHANHAESKNVTLHAESDAALPEVLADVKMIGVALSNYISNAIKYGGPSSEVLVYARATKDGKIRFGVKDRGPGIPEQDTEKVFDKFFRSSRTSAAEGIGLGLSICKDIIVAHSGTVGCTSSPGVGTDFYFDLPLS